METIVECVPNISEGQDKIKIREISSVVAREGVKLLDVSSDRNHNRSVITFAGSPKPVRDAAFDLIKKTYELIEMGDHKGEHPRMGAVDVCPFVPVKDITMDDCVKLAHELGEMVGEMGLTGYYYGEAAKDPKRYNLTDVRRGEYEGLPYKLKTEEGKPDFGPTAFNPRFGVVAIGARDVLIAFNVNLTGSDLGVAKKIATIIRQSGGVVDISGKKIRIDGAFKFVKALGIDTSDKGYVQVSMNLTNYKTDSIHVVFETIKRITEMRNIEIHSSEIVGLVPADAINYIPVEYFKIINFDPQKQIIDEALSEKSGRDTGDDSQKIL